MDNKILPKFVSQYPKVKDIVLKFINQYNLPQYHNSYIDGMISYNLVGGKMLRGLSTVKCIYLLNDSNMKDEELFKYFFLYNF